MENESPKKILAVLRPRNEKLDHFEVDFYLNDENGERVGFGYKSEDGVFHIIRCPNCGRENYAMAVHAGGCAWCGYLHPKDNGN